MHTVSIVDSIDSNTVFVLPFKVILQVGDSPLNAAIGRADPQQKTDDTEAANRGLSVL